MEYRTLGGTGLRVSALGFGGFGIGGGYLLRDKALASGAVKRALDLGVTFFDTAPYAYNDSEILLGHALKGRRDKVVLASKAERFDIATVRQCVETSLTHLQTDYLDLLQLRDPTVETLESSRFVEVCDELKAEGKIRFSAVTVGDARMSSQARLSIERGFPVIQVAYNLIFDQADAEILPQAWERNVGIIARGPLCKGFLAHRLTVKPREVTKHPNFLWFTPEEADILLQLQKDLKFLVIPGERSLAQSAIQFVLRHPAVSTTIPSLETSGDVEELAGALTGPQLTPAEIQQARTAIRKLPPIDY